MPHVLLQWAFQSLGSIQGSGDENVNLLEANSSPRGTSTYMYNKNALDSHAFKQTNSIEITFKSWTVERLAYNADDTKHNFSACFASAFSALSRLANISLRSNGHKMRNGLSLYRVKIWWRQPISQVDIQYWILKLCPHVPEIYGITLAEEMNILVVQDAMFCKCQIWGIWDWNQPRPDVTAFVRKREIG